MASGMNAAKKRQEELAASQQKVVSAAQTAQMAPTAGQLALDARTERILNNKGDWGASPDVNWASGQVSKLKDEQAQQNRGAYTMGANAANENLLAGMGAQESARAAEAEQLGSERAIAGAIDSASGNALASGGLTSQRYGSVMSSAGNMASNYNDNAIRMAQAPNPYLQLAIAGIGAVGNAASDYNLKDNIQPLSYGLETTNALRPVVWDWKNGSGRMQGLIAQEVREEIPEAVIAMDEEGTLGINYTALVPVLINAIKELSAKVEALEGRT